MIKPYKDIIFKIILCYIDVKKYYYCNESPALERENYLTFYLYDSRKKMKQPDKIKVI